MTTVTAEQAAFGQTTAGSRTEATVWAENLSEMAHSIVDERTFSELTRARAYMIEKNPNPQGVGIGAPFIPWIGADIYKRTQGIYFIGIATRGPTTESVGLGKCRAWSEETTKSPPGTPFWRYMRETTEAVYMRPYSQCISKIAWSNQFKIGIYNLVGPESLNPSGFYAESQEKISLSILQREIRLANTSAVIFLGDGPLIYPVVGEGEWDKESYRDLGIWMKHGQNGTLLLYQYHPKPLLMKGSDHFSRHVQTVASTVRNFFNRGSPLTYAATAHRAG